MQVVLNLDQGRHGGRRKNAGRKRKHSKGVAHRIREKVKKRIPLHINFKFRTYIKKKASLRILKKALINARKKGLLITHFSMQTNHIHLIVEAASNTILTSGMRALTITFSKGINQGRIQIERYHLHVLRTLREARNAVLYVLFNKQKHEKGTFSKIDEYSSLTTMKNGLKLIRDFGMKTGMTIMIDKKSEILMDQPESFHLNKLYV